MPEIALPFGGSYKLKCQPVPDLSSNDLNRMSWQIRHAEQRFHMVLVTLSVAGHEWAKRAEHVQMEMAILRADLERLQLVMLKQRRLERDALSKQRRLEWRCSKLAKLKQGRQDCI